MFDLQLDDRTRTLNASTLQFALRDIDEMSPADLETVSCRFFAHFTDKVNFLISTTNS